MGHVMHLPLYSTNTPGNRNKSRARQLNTKSDTFKSKNASLLFTCYQASCYSDSKPKLLLVALQTVLFLQEGNMQNLGEKKLTVRAPWSTSHLKDTFIIADMLALMRYHLKRSTYFVPDPNKLEKG